MRKTVLKNYHNANLGIIKLFIKTYFCDKDIKFKDVYWHCIGDEVYGCISVNDYFFNTYKMYEALMLEATRDELFTHYDMELENAYLPEKKRKVVPNLENYIKMTRSTLKGENNIKEVKEYLIKKGWNNMAEFLQPTKGNSKCCNAKVKAGGIGDFNSKDDIVTHYWVCSSCKHPCDII